ncbi:hypothetical protein [Bacteroides stercorirosoris]|nr:hypothetical protein [Bacteroides stercorirosoris]
MGGDKRMSWVVTSVCHDRPLRTPSTGTSRRGMQVGLACGKASALTEGSVFHRSLSSRFTRHFIRLKSGQLMAWQWCENVNLYLCTAKG